MVDLSENRGKDATWQVGSTWGNGFTSSVKANKMFSNLTKINNLTLNL